MRNGCIVRVAWPTADASVLAAVGEALAQVGYERQQFDDRRIRLRFAGKWLTTDLAQFKHRVEVVADDGHLVFTFSTGIVASYWTAADEQWAQARADQAVAAVRGQRGSAV